MQFSFRIEEAIANIPKSISEVAKSITEVAKAINTLASALKEHNDSHQHSTNSDSKNHWDPRNP